MKNALIYIYAFISMLFYEPVVLDHPAGIVRPIVRDAHRYHGLDAHNRGVQYSMEDETGAYFFRNGRRCELLTKRFLGVWYEAKRRREF